MQTKNISGEKIKEKWKLDSKEQTLQNEIVGQMMRKGDDVEQLKEIGRIWQEFKKENYNGRLKNDSEFVRYQNHRKQSK